MTTVLDVTKPSFNGHLLFSEKLGKFGAVVHILLCAPRTTTSLKTI